MGGGRGPKRAYCLLNQGGKNQSPGTHLCSLRSVRTKAGRGRAIYPGRVGVPVHEKLLPRDSPQGGECSRKGCCPSVLRCSGEERLSKIIHGYCTLCRSRCGTLNEVDGDQLVAVRPDNAHPTGKAMCMKGRAAPEIVHSPHRVFYPMRRTPAWSKPRWKRLRRLDVELPSQKAHDW